MDSRHPTGVAAVFGKRNETGMGVCLAITHGRRDLCYNPDWVRVGLPASSRPRINCDGPGRRNHACDHRDRSAGRQNFVLALRAFSAPALGDGPISDALTREPGQAAAQAVAPSEVGNSTAKVAPLPRPSLRARMVPPCISTMTLLMARPRPRPSRL